MPEPRAETGAMKFGHDWPGVFLRGDDAVPMSMYLGELLDAIDLMGTDNEVLDHGVDIITLHMLRGLQATLASCDTRVNEADPELKAAVQVAQPFKYCLYDE